MPYLSIQHISGCGIFSVSVVVEFQLHGTDNYVGAIITVMSLRVLKIVYKGIQLSPTTATTILVLTTMSDTILYIIGTYDYLRHNISPIICQSIVVTRTMYVFHFIYFL